MSPEPEHDGIVDGLRRLRDDPESLPWPERRSLAQSLADYMGRHGASATAMELLLLLAQDSKWEVRKDVADCLLLVPEDNFLPLAVRLSEDPNGFVRKAAERAIDRRRRGQESVQRKHRGLDQVQDQYAHIEKIHGSMAANKAMQMAERLYDVLVGATVHDMRNIVGPLRSGVASLQAHLAANDLDPVLLAKHVAKMGRQVDMLERLVEDMRAYAQPTPTQRRRERLADMVSDAHGLVLDGFKASGRNADGVRCVMQVPENLTAEVSRHQIVRAISNVLKNAYEAFAVDACMFRDGVVYVDARPVDADRLEIVIRDMGMGLSAEELAEVRRFVPGGTSKKTYGTGFGLPIAKRKIEGHGGSLAIDSQDGAGTTVTITLPVAMAGGEA